MKEKAKAIVVLASMVEFYGRDVLGLSDEKVLEMDKVGDVVRMELSNDEVAGVVNDLVNEQVKIILAQSE